MSPAKLQSLFFNLLNQITFFAFNTERIITAFKGIDKVINAFYRLFGEYSRQPDTSVARVVNIAARCHYFVVFHGIVICL